MKQCAFEGGEMEIIRTERVHLRPFVHDDVAAMCEVLSDELALQFYPRMRDERNIAEWVIRWREFHLRHGCSLWAMCLNSNNQLIGDCGLVWQEIDEGRLLEIGYHVSAAQRRRGYALEAAVACRNYAFDEMTVDKVISLVDHENTASRAVAGRLHQTVRSGLTAKGKSMLIYSSER